MSKTLSPASVGTTLLRAFLILCLTRSFHFLSRSHLFICFDIPYYLVSVVLKFDINNPHLIKWVIDMSLPATFHFAQALLCGYTGWQSYQAIWRLQGYEEQSEKAAQYSNVAAEQLHTTRTTQASGAVTVRSPLPSSVLNTELIRHHRH